MLFQCEPELDAFLEFDSLFGLKNLPTPRKSSTTIGERYFFFISFYFSSSSLMFRLLLLEQDLKAPALPLLKRFGSVLLPLVVSTYNEPKASIKLLLSLAFCHIFIHGLVHLVYIS